MRQKHCLNEAKALRFCLQPIIFG